MRKKEIYQDVRFFHGAIQPCPALLLPSSCIVSDKPLTQIMLSIPLRFEFESTAIQRTFDCSAKVTKVTVT